LQFPQIPLFLFVLIVFCVFLVSDIFVISKIVSLLSFHFLFNQTEELETTSIFLLYFFSLSLIPNNTSNLFYFSHLSLFSYSLLFISLFSLSLHNQTHHRISNEVEVSKGKNKCEVFD
jgi:hypothetical protein